MRAILILSIPLLLGACVPLPPVNRDMWQSMPWLRANSNTSCQVKKYLIDWGKEHKESNSGFANSYSITTDQGRLYVDDAAVYQEIISHQGQEISLVMSLAPGNWIVDIPGESERQRRRTRFMCHQTYAARP